MALQDGHQSGSAALQAHARGSRYVAEALRKWMTRERLTQAQAAKRLGVVQPYVSEITCNKVDKLSLDYLVGFCAKAGLIVLSGWSLSRIPYYKVRPLSLQCQRVRRYARSIRWRVRRSGSYAAWPKHC